MSTSRPFTDSSAPFRRNFDFVRVLRRCPFSMASHLVYLIPAALAGLGHLTVYLGGALDPSRDEPFWASAPEPSTLLAFAAFFFVFHVVVFRVMSRARKPAPMCVLVLAFFVPMIATMFVVTLLSYGSHPLTDTIGVVVVMYGGWWAAPAWQWPRVRELALAGGTLGESAARTQNPTTEGP